MTYAVRLGVFEGPLDLLLHLIKEAKVDIDQVSLAEVTSQYMDYLYHMQEMDMEIASDFMVVAATLLYIKSRHLLPRVDEEEEDEDEMDPEEALKLRLKEYQLFQEAAGQLGDRAESFQGVYYKLAEEILQDSPEQEIFCGVDASDLKETLMALLAEAQKRSKYVPIVHRVMRDPISVDARMRQITAHLSEVGEVRFFELFAGDIYREDVVVTFLAVLELLSESVVVISQAERHEEILITRRDDNG